MPILSRRAAGRHIADPLLRTPRTTRTAIEPMLPVVISSALFLATLAVPFVLALLIQ